MPNPFLDQYITHNIYTQRLGSHNANEFDAFIKRADRIIRDILSTAGDTIESRKTLNRIIKRLGDELSPVYADYSKLLISNLTELTETETPWNVNALGRGVDPVVSTPTSATVLGAAFSRPVAFGNTSVIITELMKSFTLVETRKVQNAVRQGWFEGQTVSEMVRTIRGTRLNKFKDGILATTTRSAQTIARTATNHIANQTRQAVLDRNDRLLDGVEWISTLDRRTSSICRIRDGIVYPVNKGPRPPAHPSCRSTIAPKVKKQFTLFSGQETRASVGATGGKPTQATNYYTWLRTQPASFQNEVLGPTKGKIFRNAGLDTAEFRKLVSNNFDQPLTIAQIRAKEPAIWKRLKL